MLNPLQQDALKEYMNVVIGQAGQVLSEMVNQKVYLEVPDVQLLQTRDRFILQELVASILKGHVVSSSLRFGVECSGRARLLFPVEKGKKLVNLMIGDEEFSDHSTNEAGFSDTDTDAMKEIGNVLLNVIIGSLGNLLSTRIEYSLPEIEFLFVEGVRQDPFFHPGHYTLVLRNTFVVGEERIEGAIFVMLQMDSATRLIEKIDEMLVDIYE
ncbi:chemotaxis protein CheC [Heliorestis acidaminivorans]|uniref:Chemotaxis protein CheC n=1 Tax=Heliorestis acidaminivorans TaxID=553427 RepID=A0A6I0F6F8_9FIRM|nr:chemotaxis protein CheC [Heliorestis acidaminivorans]KAB2954562.1 chemotaxis protein CheC [Heliorestis acidaminivorans]